MAVEAVVVLLVAVQPLSLCVRIMSGSPIVAIDCSVDDTTEVV